MRTVVIGGGIAGLAVARELAERGREVTLLEAEEMVGTHSSARNAQIWLPTEDDATTGPLARRSAERMTALLGDEDRWLRRCGAIVLVPDERAARSIVAGGARGGVEARPMELADARRRCPALGDTGDAALEVIGAGVFDPHAMIGALARAGRDAGVNLRTSTAVRVLELGGAERAVILSGSERLACDEVVIAAGAWAQQLGRSAGVEVPLVPLRRHLAVLDVPPAEAATILWRFAEPEVYWRPESGGALVSPCDEDPFDPCLPAPSEQLAERLVRALEPVVPAWTDAPVRTAWACLRTCAYDRELVLGPDPRVEGLAWLAGLGGRGMTVGVAAAELCARAMDGEEVPLAATMRPDREQPAELTDLDQSAEPESPP